MGSRGPRKQPSNVVKLKGNPGKRAVNKREPKPNEAVPSCPDFVTGVARAEWERVTPHLAAVGLLTQIDQASLAGYCQAYQRWVDAERTIAKFGTIVKTPNGFPVISPAVSIANKAMDQMLRFAREFGMTPSARSSIQLPEPQQKADPAEEFFA